MLGFPKLKIQRPPAPADLTDLDENTRAAAIGARFGLDRIVKAQEDLINTITNPAAAQQKWADDIDMIKRSLGTSYREIYEKLVDADVGLTPEEASEVADAWISKLLENWRIYLAIKYPYSFGGEAGEDPIKNLRKMSLIDTKAEAIHKAAKLLEHHE
jgi:hypothetical protein